ncbi:MAG: threonine synthase, partial [Candidatus Thorarchaeota archaeon]
MSNIKSIKCAKCGKTYDMSNVPANDGCGGRIDFEFDIELLKETITKENLAKRTPGLWKYFELMPLNNQKNIVTAGEGGTPL